ncbi:MarR family winged helix-turn-helix transcriptional regulator [Seonamhaeicola marinus]|uniref:MarR family transcriptional regulator n=1 Tax=Seonamhaeicola marinus TaxID=1912246 RepID=A0A5D0HF44_9FLAO|nr:MarR family transcriptional regulator [Seonamhaeicola marinus]TYA69973.1 MarR family transcriptional regulator [Seonamhaeicola marinus]
MKKEENPIDFESSLGPWLGKTVKMVEYHMQELFKKNGLDLTKEQMVVLKKLHEKNGMSQNELARLTFRDKSSLARLLSKMEKKMYIFRTPDETDKRVNQVFLTPKGIEMMQRARPIIKNMIQNMEQGVSLSEKQLIIQTLKKVQHNINSSIESL